MCAVAEIFASNSFNILPNLAALLTAYLLAVPIGWNREQEDRSAGLRTFPLVAVASCGVIQAVEPVMAGQAEPLARVVEGLITGIGFIGGGAILKMGRSVRGTARHGGQPVDHRCDRGCGRPWQLRCRCHPVVHHHPLLCPAAAVQARGAFG